MIRIIALNAVVLMLLCNDARADYQCSLPDVLPSPAERVLTVTTSPLMGCAIEPVWHGRRVVALQLAGLPDAVAAVVCEALTAAMLGDKLTTVLDQRWANVLCTHALALQVFDKVSLTARAHQASAIVENEDQPKVSLRLAVAVQPRIVEVSLDPSSAHDNVLTTLFESQGALYAAERIESLRMAAQANLVGAGFVNAILTVANTGTAAGIHLQLTLNRGNRATLKRIVVVGNKLISQAQVEHLLGLDFPEFNRVGGVPSVALVQLYAVPRLMRYYRQRGYLAGEVKAVSLQAVPGGEVGATQLALEIFEGNRFTLGSVVDRDLHSHPAALLIQPVVGTLFDPTLYQQLVDDFTHRSSGQNRRYRRC